MPARVFLIRVRSGLKQSLEKLQVVQKENRIRQCLVVGVGVDIGSVA